MTKSLGQDEGGSVVVEFAIVAPIVLIVLAGVVDIGSALLLKRSVEARMTAAASFALLQPAPGDGQAAEALAERLVGLLAGSASETARVIVNNAAQAASTGSTVSVAAGPGDAAMCYCPTLVQGGLVWGPAVNCASTCAGRESAGKFVQIHVTARYISIFPRHLFFEGDMVETRSVLRLQ
jgi:hypothetical protein